MIGMGAKSITIVRAVTADRLPYKLYRNENAAFVSFQENKGNNRMQIKKTRV
jgi:hypothetical protein